MTIAINDTETKIPSEVNPGAREAPLQEDPLRLHMFTLLLFCWLDLQETSPQIESLGLGVGEHPASGYLSGFRGSGAPATAPGRPVGLPSDLLERPPAAGKRRARPESRGPERRGRRVRH